jgi:hypothetical protein
MTFTLDAEVAAVLQAALEPVQMLAYASRVSRVPA